MLVDEVEITIVGGHGGSGAATFFPGKKSGPSGGNGGHGGDVYFKATSDIFALNQFSKTKQLLAQNGGRGGSNRMSGADGVDLIIYLPLGTEVLDVETGESISLDSLEDNFLAAKGGLGGRGNYELKSPRFTTPEFAQPGLPGVQKRLKLTLKLIADFGLIGLPNAGKSSLLNELTAANAKVADYPFTTLEPNLGVIGKKVIADIPGLIEGASTGKGLGIKFLKHVEKVGLLLHCVSAESADVVKDYLQVRKEISDFSQEIASKKEIILLTKSDLVSKDEIKEQAKKLKKHNKDIHPISIHDWDSIKKIEKLLS